MQLKLLRKPLIKGLKASQFGVILCQGKKKGGHREASYVYWVQIKILVTQLF